MTKEKIQLYLIDCFLNGYKLNDTTYEQMIEHFKVIKIQVKRIVPKSVAHYISIYCNAKVISN